MVKYRTRMQRHERKTKKNIIILFIFLLTVLMTAAYAAYSRDLIINSVGKIYNDWDLRFTKIECTMESNETDEAFCEVDDTFLTKYELGIIDEGDDLGGYELTFLVGFMYPTDNATFDIEITNYSDNFEALLDSVSYKASEHQDDFILYDLSEFIPGTTYIPQNTRMDDHIKTFTVTAYWNPALETKLPNKSNFSETSNKENPIVKSDETAINETYTETQKIILVWSPRKP